MAIEWYYSRGGKRLGPVSTDELKNLAATGEVDRDELVWREGMSDWEPVSNFRGLVLENGPPPLPPTHAESKVDVSGESQATQQTSNGLIPAGYVCAVLALVLLPIPFALAGFVCGVVNITRGASGHGLAQIILSAACGLIGTSIGAAMLTM